MMKLLAILPLSLLLFTGCSQKGAFSNFELTRKQEFSISNTQRSKITSLEKVEGTFTAIYLNNIYPEIYQEKDAFLVFIYTKDKTKTNKILFLANDKEALKVEEVKDKEEFKDLVEMQNSWNSCYFMEFLSDEKREVRFGVQNDNYKSTLLIYKKM